MPIKRFSFSLPETRFFHTKKDVFKFKFHYGAHFPMEDTQNKEYISEEIVDSIRAVLANHENLHPFCTEHFIIFPYKTKWDSAARLRFTCGDKTFNPFPFVFTLYIEPKSYLPEKQSNPRDIEEQSSDLTEKEDDGAMKHEETSAISAVTQIPKCQVQADQDPGPSCGSNIQTGGITRFLTRLNPLQFLFGGWKRI
ncbi:membrane-anchored junction protein-like isoform X2 [Xenopus laevis]|uniref:Membrane-anchored junction protein-like isoform X2 n=1 Tax=Xenopus laevis TaxID=8355 RepID=A0A8J1KH67_XENLA|nr:membrane-anchored junction protein-like isoform X2 [Xenopus laevis]